MFVNPCKKMILSLDEEGVFIYNGSKYNYKDFFMKVEFFRHNIDKTEIDAVISVLSSLFITTGEVVADFEKSLSSYLGGGYTAGVTSCTAAMHLSLEALGVKKGDEVITSPLTFVSSASSIIMAGATPVFADVDKDTGLLNPKSVKEKITDKTKAIIPVHLYGQMCDMRAFREIADEYNLKLVEDCAHCIEGSREGVTPASLGDVACFSFYATKNITCAEGGAVFSKNAKTIEKVKKLRLHGMTLSAIDRYTKGFKQYDIECMGYKYNMANLNASMLLNQIKMMDSYLKRRVAICDMYDSYFAENKAVVPVESVKNSSSAKHLYVIRVDKNKRDEYMNLIQQKEIGVAIHFKPVHLMTFYKESFGYKEGDFPVAEEFASSIISLPLYSKLTDEEVKYVADTVNEIVK